MLPSYNDLMKLYFGKNILYLIENFFKCCNKVSKS